MRALYSILLYSILFYSLNIITTLLISATIFRIEVMATNTIGKGEGKWATLRRFLLLLLFLFLFLFLSAITRIAVVVIAVVVALIVVYKCSDDKISLPLIIQITSKPLSASSLSLLALYSSPFLFLPLLFTPFLECVLSKSRSTTLFVACICRCARAQATTLKSKSCR